VSEEKSFAYGKLALGVLVVGLCGSCTLHFTMGSNPYDRVFGGIALFVGGIPTLLGLGLTAVAVQDLLLERRKKPPGGPEN
jgi:hypothetical protein